MSNSVNLQPDGHTLSPALPAAYSTPWDPYQHYKPDLHMHSACRLTMQVTLMT